MLLCSIEVPSKIFFTSKKKDEERKSMFPRRCQTFFRRQKCFLCFQRYFSSFFRVATKRELRIYCETYSRVSGRNQNRKLCDYLIWQRMEDTKINCDVMSARPQLSHQLDCCPFSFRRIERSFRLIRVCCRQFDKGFRLCLVFS